MDDVTRDGLILVCARDGTIEQVLYDGLALTDASSIGQPFPSLVLNESLRTALDLLDAMQANTPSFDWVLHVHTGSERLFLHVLGYALDQKLILIGAQSRTRLRELYHHMLKAHHGELATVSELLQQERDAHTTREQALQTQVDQLTDQLNVLHIEIAQKYMPRPPLAEPQTSEGMHIPQWLRKREQLLRELQDCEQARAALHESQTLFACFFGASPAPTYVTDLSDGHIVDVNTQFEQLFGYAREQIVGKPWHELFSSAGCDAMLKATTILQTHPAVYDAELMVRTKDGVLREAQLSLALTEVATEQYVLHTVYDITEAKRAAQATQTELAHLREDVTRLTQDLAQREDQSQQFMSVSETLTTLRAELDSHHAHEQALRADIQELQAQALDYQQQYQTECERAAELERAWHARQQSEQQSVAELTALHADLRAADEHVHDPERQRAAQAEREQQWSAEPVGAHDAADSHGQPLSDYEQRTENFNRELSMSMSHARSEAREQELLSEVMALRDEVLTLRMAEQVLSAEQVEANEHMRRLQQQHEEAALHEHRLHDQLLDARQQIAIDAQHVTEYRQHLDMLRTQANAREQELTSEVAVLRERMAQRASEIEQSHEIIKQLHYRIEEAEATSRALDAAVRATRTEKEAAQLELASVESNVTDLRQQITAHEEREAYQQHELIGLRSAVHELEQHEREQITYHVLLAESEQDLQHALTLAQEREATLAQQAAAALQRACEGESALTIEQQHAQALSLELNAARDHAQQLDAELDALRAQYAQRETELAGRIADLQTLGNELVRRDQQVREWEQQSAVLRTQSEVLERKLDEVQQSEQDLQQHVTTLEQEKATLTSKQKVLFEQMKQFITKQKQREHELEEQLATAREQSAQWEAELSVQTERAQTQAEQLHQREAEVQQSNVAIGQLENEVLTLQQSLQTVTLDLLSARERARWLQSELGTSRVREQDSNGRLAYLQEQLNTIRVETAEQRQREQDLLDRFANTEREWRAQLERLTAEYTCREEELVQQLALTHTEREQVEQSLQSMIDQLEAAQQSALAQVEDARNQISALQAQICVLESNLQAQQSIAQEQAQEIRQWQERAQQLDNVMSFREQTWAEQTGQLELQMRDYQIELSERDEREQNLKHSEVMLLEKVSRLEDELGQREKRFQEQRDEIDSLLAQVAQLNASIEQRISLLQAQPPFLSIRADALEQELSAQRQAEQLLLEQVRTWRAQADAREQQLIRLLGTLPSEKAGLEQQISEAQQREHDVLSELTSLRDQLTQLNVQLGERQIGERDLLSTIAVLERMVQERAAQLATERAEALAREQTLLTQSAQWREMASALELQVAEQKQRESELKNEVDVLRGQLLLLELELNKHKQRAQELGEQTTTLHGQLGEMEFNHKQGKRRLKRQLAATRERAHRKEQELTKQTELTRAAREESEQSVAQLVAQQQTQQSLQTELNAAQEQVQAFTVELSAQREREQQLNAYLADLRQQVDVLEQTRASHDVQQVEVNRLLTLLQQQIEFRNGELVAMNTVARLGLDSSDPHAVLGTAIAQVSEQFHADGCYVLGWDEQNQVLIPITATGLYEDTFPTQPFALHELNISESVLFAGHALFVEGVVDLQTPNARQATGTTYSTLGVPLIAQGAKHGVLLMTFAHSHDFSADEIERAEQFAYQIAITLAHMQQHRALRSELDVAREQTQQLRQLSRMLAAGEELTQQELARQLQHCVGQNLTMLSVGLDALPSDLPSEIARIVSVRVNASQKLIAEIGNHVRDVIAELHPPVLDDGGLLEALRWYSQQLSKRSGLRVVVHGEPIVPRLELTLEQVLFRIAQRTLTHINRTGLRGSIHVTLDNLSDQMQLRIAGDGVAIMDTSQDDYLFDIHARATTIGAQVRLHKAHGDVGHIMVEIPKATLSANR